MTIACVRDFRAVSRAIFRWVPLITGYAENAVLGHGHLDPGMQVVTKPFDVGRHAERIRPMVVGAA